MAGFVTPTHRVGGLGHTNAASDVSENVVGEADQLAALLDRERSNLLAQLATATPATNAGDARREKVLKKLGVLLLISGNHDEALRYADEQLEVAQRLYGKNSVEEAAVLRQIASIYGMNADTRSQAKTLLLRALGIFVRCLGENHSKVVDTLTSLAVLCNRSGNFSEADTYNRRALVMYHQLREGATKPQDRPGVPHPPSAKKISSGASAGTGAGAGSGAGAGDDGVTPPPARLGRGDSHDTNGGGDGAEHGRDGDHAFALDDDDDDDDGEVCEEFKTFDWTQAVAELLGHSAT